MILEREEEFVEVVAVLDELVDERELARDRFKRRLLCVERIDR